VSTASALVQGTPEGRANPTTCHCPQRTRSSRSQGSIPIALIVLHPRILSNIYSTGPYFFVLLRFTLFTFLSDLFNASQES
jgi:hypothetical protein